MDKWVRRRHSLLLIGLTLLLLISAMLLQVTKVRSDDPDSDDSTYLAQGPVLDATTLAANRATADTIGQQEEQDQQWAAQHPELMAPKGGSVTLPTLLPVPTIVAGIYADCCHPSGWGTLYPIFCATGGRIAADDPISMIARPPAL